MSARKWSPTTAGWTEKEIAAYRDSTLRRALDCRSCRHLSKAPNGASLNHVGVCRLAEEPLALSAGQICALVEFVENCPPPTP
jgi:hypothetical protein